MALIDINQELGFPVYNVPYTAGVDESPFLDKQNYMIHSGEVETSLILSYDESLVEDVYKRQILHLSYLCFIDYLLPAAIAA